MAERTKKLPAPRALAAHAEAVVRKLHVLGLARVADLQRAVPELASVRQASKVVDGLIELEWLEEAEQRQADPLGGNGRPGRVLCLTAQALRCLPCAGRLPARPAAPADKASAQEAGPVFLSVAQPRRTDGWGPPYVPPAGPPMRDGAQDFLRCRSMHFGRAL